MTQTHTPTEDQILRAEVLREEGNKHYRAKEFGQALAIYTEALSLNPNSAVIYLNRSAAFLSKQQYAQSLNDANHAIELAPNWSKPQKRQAVLLELLNRDIDANYSFLDAVEKVGTDPTLDDETKQKEYKDLNKRMYDLVKKINKPEIRAPTGQMGFLIPDNPGIRVKVAKERKVAEGDTSWPEVGMYHRKLLDAQTAYETALDRLMRYRLIFKSGRPCGRSAITGELDTLFSLATAIIEDTRVVALTRESFKRLGLVIDSEPKQYDTVDPNTSPKETIQIYNKRLTTPSEPDKPGVNYSLTGWDQVRRAAQTSIALRILYGYIGEHTEYEQHVGHNQPEDDIRLAVEMIEEGRRVFAGVPDETRGQCFSIEFLRAAKIMLGETLAATYTRKPQNRSQNPRLLEEVAEIGHWLRSSFECYPTPSIPKEDPEYWHKYYTYYLRAKQKAHWFLGFANHRSALNYHKIHLDHPDGRRGPFIYEPKGLARAAYHYAMAAAWSAYDDPERETYLRGAIHAMVFRGDYATGDLMMIGDLANHVRDFIRPLLEDLRTSRLHEGFSAMRAFLKMRERVLPQMINAIELPLLTWETGVQPDLEVTKETAPEHCRELMVEDGFLDVVGYIKAGWAERKELCGETTEMVGDQKIMEKLSRPAVKWYEEEPKPLPGPDCKINRWIPENTPELVSLKIPMRTRERRSSGSSSGSATPTVAVPTPAGAVPVAVPPAPSVENASCDDGAEID